MPPGCRRRSRSEIRSVEKGNLPDGMESLFDGTAGLRFSRDKRMLEVWCST